MSVLQQLVHILAVNGFPLTLAAGGGTVRYAFVKADAQPSQGFDDVGLGTGHKAVRIGIFNAEDHFSPVLFGKKIIVQSGAHAADVQRPGRTGSETYADVGV